MEPITQKGAGFPFLEFAQVKARDPWLLLVWIPALRR